MIRKIHFLLVLLIFHQCNTVDDENLLTTVDIESNIDKMEMLKLSSFTNDIDYISLENVKNLSLQNLNQITISENLILVSDISNCILYNNEGEFVSQIGNNGRGPEEYQVIFNSALLLGENPRVYLSSLYDIYEFNINGSFLNKYSESLLINNYLSITRWHLINDSLFFGHIANNTGSTTYKAAVFNKYGTIKDEYKNYITYNNAMVSSIGGWETYAHIYRFNKSVFYKELFNDTLFFLNEDYKLIPKYFFNLGNYKMPLSERAKDPSLIWNYITLYNVFQTKNYLFLNCRFGHRFPAKRITPKLPLIQGGDPVWINTNYVLGVYDKRTRKLLFCKPSNTDNPLFTSGLYNDIDCGPRFFPKTMVNDSTMGMCIEAKQFKDHVASDDFKNGVAKYPEKKRKLEEFAENLSEYDNPVLMLVTFNE